MGRGQRRKEQERCKGLTLRAIRLLQLGLVGSVHSAQPLSMRWWCGMDRPKGQEQDAPSGKRTHGHAGDRAREAPTAAEAAVVLEDHLRLRSAQNSSHKGKFGGTLNHQPYTFSSNPHLMAPSGI